MFSRFLLKRAFSTANVAKANIPIVDITNYVNGQGSFADCKAIAEAFEETSCVLIKDPRVTQPTINEFIDLMETYFESRGKKYYNKQYDLNDFYPEYLFQTGATPDHLLIMKDYTDIIKTFTENNKPTTPYPPRPDSKWRYMWRIGERVDNSKYYSVDPPVHIPEDFPQWKPVMDNVGQLLLDGCYTVSEMLALGLGLEKNLFREMLQHGPQILAPQGSDLRRYDVGTSLSAFHYDLNFLTIHGRNRYPGLFIWLKNGEKKKVSVPEGHLLLQVGKQLEMLTGGHLQAGWHEVVVTEEAKNMVPKALEEGRSPWRVNTTIFVSTQPEIMLQPLDKFATHEAMKKYPPIITQKQMEEEFKDMNMSQEKFQKISKAKSL